MQSPAVLNVPQPDGLVVTARGEQAAPVGQRERGERPHPTGVTSQRRTDRAARGRVPQPDGLVVTARGEQAAPVGQRERGEPV